MASGAYPYNQRERVVVLDEFDGLIMDGSRASSVSTNKGGV